MIEIRPLQKLAEAIIVQAAKDYRASLRGKRVGDVRRLSPNEMKDECERFFRSQYFVALTDLDGEYIIEQIQKEVKAGRTKNPLRKFEKY